MGLVYPLRWTRIASLLLPLNPPLTSPHRFSRVTYQKADAESEVKECQDSKAQNADFAFGIVSNQRSRHTRQRNAHHTNIAPHHHHGHSKWSSICCRLLSHFSGVLPQGRHPVPTPWHWELIQVVSFISAPHSPKKIGRVQQRSISRTGRRICPSDASLVALGSL